MEGWVWTGLWQVAGVPQPSDLNPICPHAKGMHASEGEWHLDTRIHTHARPKSQAREAAVMFSRNCSSLCNRAPVMSTSINLRHPRWSSWYRQTSLWAIFNMLMVEKRQWKSQRVKKQPAGARNNYGQGQGNLLDKASRCSQHTATDQHNNKKETTNELQGLLATLIKKWT